jgi:class 3 adenylate cyclase
MLFIESSSMLYQYTTAFYKSTLIWIMLPVILGFWSCTPEILPNPTAVKGILDAGTHVDEDLVALYLDGEWEFYPNQLLSPKELKSVSTTLTMPSPGLWNQHQQAQHIKYATYRLRIVNHYLPHVISIRNHQIFSAFRLYLNGREIMANGVVADNAAGEIPSFHPRTVSVYSTADTLDFVLQVSNHHYRTGGIAESFLVGKVNTLLRSNLSATGLDFFLLGSLLIMAIYYLSLFFVLRKDSSSLYFSILILVSIIRIMVTGQRLLFYIMPQLSWEVMLRLEFGTFFIAPVFFILFFNAVYREEIKIWVVNTVMAVSVVFTLLVVFTPVRFFSQALVLYQVYIIWLAASILWWLLKAIRNKKEGALVLLLGVVILMSVLVHDLVIEYSSLRNTHLFPAGIFLFILCQSYVLNKRFATINKENRNLWEELDFKNKNLEHLVIERTMELQKQKDLLQHTNRELEQKRIGIENQTRMMEDINDMLEKEKEKTDRLLLNVLPRHIAQELKLFGKSLAHSYPRATVMFIDFVDFSNLAENLSPSQLLDVLHVYFAGFDDITRKYNLEKIKTIGDAYMCAGGLNDQASSRDITNTILAGLEMSLFVKAQKEENMIHETPWFECRIGIHTGPVIAGVVGKSKFAFDIWGSTVNVSKRMEAACEPGKVNISECTWNYIKDEFICQSRGIIQMKHQRDMMMFYVETQNPNYIPR